MTRRTRRHTGHPLTALAAATLLACAAPAQAYDDFGDLFRYGLGDIPILWIKRSYQLSSGSYRSDTAVLGSGDPQFFYSGTVWQTGGSWTVNKLQLGGVPGAFGNYTLDAGTLGTGGTGVATSDGWGTFTQNGGVHVVLGELAVGGTTCCRGSTKGSYIMAGGTLSARTLRVGAASSWEQLAGDAAFGSGSIINGGFLDMRGGQLRMTGTLEVQRAYFTVGSRPSTMSFSGGVMTGTLAVVGELTATGGDLRGLLDVRTDGVATINGIFSPDSGLKNAGTLTVTNNSWLTLQGSGLVNASGGVLSQAGRVDGSAAWANHGQATLAGELRGSGAMLNSGTVLVERSLLVERNGVLTNTGDWTTRASIITLGSTAQVLNQGRWLLDRSQINGAGRFVNDTSGEITSQGNSRLTVGFVNRGLATVQAGVLTLSDYNENPGTLRLADGGSQLTGGLIKNTGTIVGRGRIDNAISQQGTVRAENGSLSLHGTFESFSGSRIEVAAGSRLQLASGNPRLLGTVALEAAGPGGAPAVLGVAGNLEFNGSLTGSGRIEALSTRLAGSMHFSEGASAIAGTVDLRNSGRITLDFGATLRLEDAVTLRGSSQLNLAVGSMVFFDDAVSVETGARVVGNGFVQIGSLLDLGAGISSLSFGGQLLFSDGSRYRAQIGALGHDRLTADTGIGFGGALVLELIPGFVPTAGARYQLFSASQFGGAFAQIRTDGAVLPSGLEWDFSMLPSTGVVGVMAAVPEVPAPLLMATGLMAIGLQGWRRRRAPAGG